MIYFRHIKKKGNNIMNKEVIKAMEKKEESSFNNFRKWWSRNRHKIFRVILFPIYIITILCNKRKEIVRKANPWNEARAEEILNYYIPRSSNWSDEEKAFYYFNNGVGWNMCFFFFYFKRKDRNFWKYNYNQIRRYIIDKVELEGFVKKVGECSVGWTELNFTLIDSEEK